MPHINRRSFLKLMGIAAPALMASNVAPWMQQHFNSQASSKPNIIVLLFDAMSAANLSVYGYPRRTSPNLERFAEHANVYHSHHSGGNYTIPGTASILTGTYPWTHRAVNHSGEIKHDLVEHNIFHALGGEYHRLAFPQNVWASLIASQFEKDIDVLLSPDAFGELDFLLASSFPNDRNMAARALDDFIFKDNQTPVSLLLGSLQSALYLRKSTLLDSQGYPRGLPRNVNYPVYFRLEKVMENLAMLLSEQTSPYFSYLHLFPPHAPYRPTGKFNKTFADDGFTPISKPIHRFSDNIPDDRLNVARQSYDRYIASLDDELGHLLDSMERSGIFDDSYVVITSDHGEMFERGEKAHDTSLLYEPVIHSPLLISAPGQKERRDIYSPTSAVDLLPTFAGLAGNQVPSWTDGVPLPYLGGVEDMDRAVYTVEAKRSSAFRPFKKATIALRKGDYKLIYYTGYEAEDAFELYDLREDAEELEDLYPSKPVFAKRMMEELLEALLAANKPYLK